METLHRLIKGGSDTEPLLSRGVADPIRAATDTDVGVPGDGSVITREFGPRSVHGKRHSKSVNTIARLFSSKIVKIQIIISR
jgi:hypothetical protein